MPTNSKDTKGLGKAIIDAVGLLSFLFGSLILLAIAFGAIGSIFMSTKRLFQLRRVKKDEDNTHSEPEGGEK
jgi:divalent metal cation (Fe/Co/Zn/Cd) transporter